MSCGIGRNTVGYIIPEGDPEETGGGVSRGVYRSADDAFVDGMALGDGRAI